MTVRAIYEKGVFRPLEPVDLPEQTEVEVKPKDPTPGEKSHRDAIFAVLRKSYASGETDVAERHNEHQP
jgi:predicted DNA-binding antitoxin AbrB/MazE fold protein